MRVTIDGPDPEPPDDEQEQLRTLPMLAAIRLHFVTIWERYTAPKKLGDALVSAVILALIISVVIIMAGVK